MTQKKFSTIERIKSFKYAIKGILSLIKEEHNARVHLSASILVLMASIYFRLDKIEMLLIVFCIGLVFVTELINTAIENVANHIEPNWNETIGKIKDYSAGAALISVIASVITGLTIFLPKIF